MSAVRLLPWVVHEAIEYVVGLFLVLAPFLFGFDQEGDEFLLFIAVGVVILIVAILSRGPAGVVDVLPSPVHAALDYLLGIFLIIAPFLFAFRDNSTALTISILIGVAHLVITLVTRFPHTVVERPAGDERLSAPGEG